MFALEGTVAEPIAVTLASTDDEGAEVAARVGGTYRRLDVTAVASWAEVIEATMADHGRIDGLVNNAGIFRLGGVLDSDVDTFRLIQEVNQVGVFNGMAQVAPVMKEAGKGSIVNISSVAGLRGYGSIAYTASKWAVVGITQGLFHQMETENTGVGVSCLCPGFVATDIDTSERNRPEWAMPNALAEPTEKEEMGFKFFQELLAAGMKPDAVADLVHDAVVNDRFWIFTDLDMVQWLADKHDSIMENRNPVSTQRL